MDSAELKYNSFDNNSVFKLIKISRDGVDFAAFDQLRSNFPFSLDDWATILHLSVRSIQRYQRENKKFDSMQSERLLQIIILLQRGIEVFGKKEYFNTWLETKNIALGGAIPKSLLDNAFGINLLRDELTKIEHGVLS